jgi:hypothetical protein
MIKSYQDVLKRVTERKGFETTLRLASCGIRAVFDFGSVESREMPMAEKLEWLTTVLDCGVRVGHLELAFCEVMATHSYSKEQATYAFNASVKQLLDAAIREMSKSPLERLAGCGE